MMDRSSFLGKYGLSKSTGMAFEHYAAYKFWNVDKDKQLTHYSADVQTHCGENIIKTR